METFEFVHGSRMCPSGNLLVYARTPGYNFLSPGCELIFCNVMVSFIADEDKFPVVAFPPKALAKERDIAKLVEIHPHYDVIRIEDFEVEPERDLGAYIHKRIRKFNAFIVEYVEMCHDYLYKQSKTQTKQMHSGLLLGQPSHAAPLQNQDSDEKLCLERLERYVFSKSNESLLPRLRNTIKLLSQNYPRYDSYNLARALGLAGEKQRKKKNVKLAKLYIRKFQAIYHENYEEAAQLQRCIRDIEHTPNT